MGAKFTSDMVRAAVQKLYDDRHKRADPDLIMCLLLAWGGHIGNTPCSDSCTFEKTLRYYWTVTDKMLKELRRPDAEPR